MHGLGLAVTEVPPVKDRQGRDTLVPGETEVALTLPPFAIALIEGR